MKQSIFPLLVLVLVSISCVKDDPVPSAPVITSLSAVKGAYDDMVTINGDNFSAVAGENEVTFNGKSAIVAAAAKERLDVKVPKGAGTGVVKVTVAGMTAEGPSFEYVITYVVSAYIGDGSPSFLDGTGTGARIYSPMCIALASNGTMYVGAQSRVCKINSDGGLTTMAGSSDQGFVNANGSSAQFQLPLGICVDAAGNVIVADGLNHVLRKIDAINNVTTYAGTGTNGYLDGDASSALIMNTSAVTSDASGNIYFTDSYRIRKVDAAGNVSTIAGGAVSGNVDANGASARFKQPFGIARSTSGDLFVADDTRIRKIDVPGNVTTVTVTGASFLMLGGIVIDAQNNIFVTDQGGANPNQVAIVYKIDASGNATKIAGGPTGYAEGNGANARFSGIGGIVIDGTGNLYVTDASNNRIRKLTPQ